jgi:hypothetical protein
MCVNFIKKEDTCSIVKRISMSFVLHSEQDLYLFKNLNYIDFMITKYDFSFFAVSCNNQLN